MTKREQFLAIAVAGVVGVLGLQFVVNSINAGFKLKQDQIAALDKKIEQEQKKITDCRLAQKRMNQLKPKGLPGNVEKARNDYAAWLMDLAQRNGVQNAQLEPQTASGLKTDAYVAYRLKLNGDIRLDDLVKLLHGYYSRDYLQKIRDLKVTQLKDNPEMAQIQLDTEAISIKGTLPDQEPSLASSNRLTKSADEYIEAIFTNSPFTAPNRAPKFSLAGSFDIPRDREYALDLKAADPDNRHKVHYTLLSDKPEGLKFDERAGKITWTPKANGNYELLVKATDSGLPAKSAEHRMTLKVIDPPPPPPAPTPEPTFDVASQSYVSAVLGGRQRNELWIRSKTDNKFFVATVGDEISVGSVKGKVLDVNVDEQFAELETEGRRWILSMDDQSVQSAYKKSLDN